MREATRIRSCTEPAALTKSLPVLLEKHAKCVCVRLSLCKKNKFHNKRRKVQSSTKFSQTSGLKQTNLLTLIAATFIPEVTDQNVPLTTSATKHLQQKCSNVSIC